MRPVCRIQRQLEQLEELLERSEVVRSMQQLPNSGPLLPRSTLESKPSLTKQYAVYWASACAPRACLRERGRCTATERRMIAASDVGTEVAEGIRGDAVLSSELMVLEAAEQDFELSSARRGSFVPPHQVVSGGAYRSRSCGRPRSPPLWYVIHGGGLQHKASRTVPQAESARSQAAS